MDHRHDALKGLYGIVGPPDGVDATDGSLLVLADALLASGCPIIQLRHKGADDRRLLGLARALVEKTRAAGAFLVVNDRLDIALLAGSDGVHLGQTDMSVEDARRVVAKLRPETRFIIGVSTHDLDEVREATSAGADYLGFGAVFSTTSKAVGPEQGTERLAQAVNAAGRTPVVAIGGVSLDNAALVAATGAAMGAVISDVARAANPLERAGKLHEALGGRPPLDQEMR